jgi:hypothetical protein
MFNHLLSTRLQRSMQVDYSTWLLYTKGNSPRPSRLELVCMWLHIKQITTMKPKLRSKNNLPRMRHTFYTPTTHSWFRSKRIQFNSIQLIETLIAHVHSICNWPDIHIHAGVGACLSPFLQEKKKHISIHTSLKENVYTDVKST